MPPCEEGTAEEGAAEAGVAGVDGADLLHPARHTIAISTTNRIFRMMRIL